MSFDIYLQNQLQNVDLAKFMVGQRIMQWIHRGRGGGAEWGADCCYEPGVTRKNLK